MTRDNIDLADPEHSVLVVVDVQGRLARLMHESDAMIRAQEILIRACRMLAIPVLWTEQVPDKLGATVDELHAPLEGLSPCVKSSFGCMGDSQFGHALSEIGRRRVLLCGIEAHVCVWQTAAALVEQGYSVHLIADAVSSRSAFNRDIALRRMERAGVHLSNVEMVLFELMGNAEHPRFRDVTGLLR